MDKKRKPEVTYICGVCDDDPSMNFEEMMQHCEEAHGEVVRGKRVPMEMITHMDGSEWFSYCYKITTEKGLVFYQNAIYPRR